MRLLSKFKDLWQQERAAVAVITTVFLTAMVGVTGAAVDMGRAYSSYNELQNAADAAAKAGADSMLLWSQENILTTKCEVAIETAQQYSLQMEPAWARNLRANPEVVTLRAGLEERRSAEVLTGSDRDEAWRLAVATYPGFERYQVRLAREIPVFRLRMKP